MTAEPITRERTGVLTTQVLIVGAGPAGLVLACDLARRGIAHQLVERDERHFAGSRGKGLQPRTQEVFEDLGFLPRVQAHGGAYPAMRLYQEGEVVREGRMDEWREPTPDVPHPNAWMLPQWRTGELLRERLAESGGSVRLATELVSFTQDPDGVTAVVRHDGGQEQEIRADYLIGADGGRSAVRRALGVGFAGETREEQRMVIADVRAEGVDRDYWHVWSSKDADRGAYPLAMCPLAGTDTFQLVRPVPVGEPAPEMTIAALQQAVDEAVGSGQIRLTEVLWHSLYRANMRMAERFRVGRVFLVGDAAHVHSPAGGQGLNTSVQDAYNLGWKLAAVLGGAPAALLDTYEEERLPVAADVLGISTRLHDKGFAKDADAHRRDDPRLRQLGLGYRESSLSREERSDRDSGTVPEDEPGGVPAGDHVPGGHPVQTGDGVLGDIPVRTGEHGLARDRVLAGDRAPDAPGEGPRGELVRLFDLFRGPHVTLLAFGPHAARVAADLAGRAGVRPVAVLGAGGSAPAGVYGFGDTEGHAGRAYGAYSAYGAEDGTSANTLLVVRPDGYLGLALDANETAADRLRDYLDRVSPSAESAAPRAALPT